MVACGSVLINAEPDIARPCSNALISAQRDCRNELRCAISESASSRRPCSAADILFTGMPVAAQRSICRRLQSSLMHFNCNMGDIVDEGGELEQ